MPYTLLFMPTPAQAIRAKFDHALKQIRHFQDAVRDFHASEPHTVTFTEDREAKQRIFFLAEVGEVPLGISAIAADALQNLRAVLDHIVYQSELKGNGGTAPLPHIYFPIAKDEKSYLERRANLKHSTPAVIAEIDAVEPYASGKGRGLWELNSLNKADKHRLLIATGPFCRGVDVSPDIREAMREIVEKQDLGADLDKLVPPLFLRPADKSAKIGDKLYIEPLDNPLKKDRKFLLDVSFHHPNVLEYESASTTLERFASLVVTVIKRLEPLID